MTMSASWQSFMIILFESKDTLKISPCVLILMTTSKLSKLMGWFRIYTFKGAFSDLRQ